MGFSYFKILGKLVLKQCNGFAKDLRNFDVVLRIFIQIAETNPPTTNTEINFSSKNQPKDNPKQRASEAPIILKPPYVLLFSLYFICSVCSMRSVED